MFFILWYVVVAVITSVLLLVFINIVRCALGKQLKWKGFAFSTRNYHVGTLPLFVPFLVWWFFYNDTEPLVLLAFFAIAGVIGEIVFSFFWDLLFDKRFWVYRVSTMVNSYSSWLNFIPWGVGGMLYIALADFVGLELSAEMFVTFWGIFFLLGSMLVLWRIWVKVTCDTFATLEFKEVSYLNYSIALSPFVFAVLATAYLYDNYALIYAAILFGSIAFIVEYGFGKACKVFVSKQLWTYTYKSYDSGHITPLSIVPFSLAGFWFVSAYYLLQYLVI